MNQKKIINIFQCVNMKFCNIAILFKTALSSLDQGESHINFFLTRRKCHKRNATKHSSNKALDTFLSSASYVRKNIYNMCNTLISLSACDKVKKDRL